MGTKEDHKHNGDNQLQPIDELCDYTVEEYRSPSGRSCQQGLAVLGAGCAGVRGSGRALPRLIAPCVHGSSASCQVSSRLSYTSERSERGHHQLTRVTSGMNGGHPLQFSERWPLRKVADYCVDWCADPQKKNTMFAVSISRHRHQLYRCLFVVSCVVGSLMWFVGEQVSW